MCLIALRVFCICFEWVGTRGLFGFYFVHCSFADWLLILDFRIQLWVYMVILELIGVIFGYVGFVLRLCTGINIGGL